MGNRQNCNKTNLSELTEENITFLLNNTSFDRDQIYDWHRGFLRECPSGRMTLENFIKFYSNFFPNGDASKFCKRVFKVFDTNRSGKIDFDELMLAISVNSLGNLEKKLTLAFQIYDLDKNGVIDTQEMISVIDAMYDLLDCSEFLRTGPNSSEERANSIIDKLDKNNDKVLSRQEFIEGCLKDPVICQLLIPYA